MRNAMDQSCFIQSSGGGDLILVLVENWYESGEGAVTILRGLGGCPGGGATPTGGIF